MPVSTEKFGFGVMDCDPEAAEERQQTVKASLLASSTSLTLVGIAEAAEKKDEVLDVVEDEPRDPDVTNYGKELLELQRRRRSSLYVKENLAKVLDVREEPFGWVIVLAVFMIHVIVDGMTYSFGALYSELRTHYDASAVTISMVLSILVGVTYGCGPLASFLCDKFGSRTVALLGAVMACTGCLLSLVSSAVWQLALTYGALTGLGFGFMYLPAIVCVASWFEERRAIAVSIAVCGSGVGTFIFNPLTTFLIDYYGLFGCRLILAGIAIQGAVFCALLRTPPRHRDAVHAEPQFLTLTHHRRGRRQTAMTIRVRRWIKNEVDWKLITNSTFILYCVSSFLGGISCYVPYVYLQDRANEESNIATADASWLLSIVGISNIVGRLTSGVLSDQKLADNVVLYSISCVAAGIATSLSIYCNAYVPYVIYASIFGYTGGIIVAMQSVVLTDIVGVDRISNAFGILLFVQGVAVFVGPPSAGFIIETYKGPQQYQVCFVVFGVIMILSGLLLLLVPILNRTKKFRRRVATAVEEERPIDMEELSVMKPANGDA